MLIFIALSLALSFIVQTHNYLQNVLSSPLFIYIGLTGAIAAIAGILLKKWSERICYELFSTSALLTWFAYWQPFFNGDAPMFFFFPLFFACMATFVSLAYIGQRDKIDRETLVQMRLLSENKGLQPGLIMIGVLASLELQDHYLVFPVMITLLLLRFALSGCIERN